MSHLKLRSRLRNACLAVVVLMGAFFAFQLEAVNVSMRAKNITVREAVLMLQQKSGISIIVKADEVDMNKRVSVSVENQPVNNALSQIFKGQRVSYTQEGKSIIVESAKKKASMLKVSKDGRKLVVRGKVETENDTEPLIGVTVSNVNSKKNVITDVSGDFAIEALEGEHLVFSYIGYDDQSVTVRGDDYVTVKMKEKSTLLDEVVIVGFGSQKKVNLTGAVGVIGSDEVNGRPVVSAAQALQGLDPSLNISMNSGIANASYNIDIRGTSSLNGGTPLILVDGVEMDLARINPNDIESVSVLKDASAASVYGAKASSGVVLVTTKTSNDSKVKVTYNGRFGLVKSTTSTDYITNGYDWVRITDLFMNTSKGYGYTTYGEEDYAELWMRRGDVTENASRPWTQVQPDGTYKYYANFDWYDYFYKRTRTQQEHNVAIRGGNEKINFYVSGRYYGAQGIMNIPNDPFDSYNLRSKLNVNIKSWLRFSTNVNYYYGKMWWPGMKSPQTQIRNAAMGAGAYIPARNPDGTIVHEQTYTNQSTPVGSGMNLILSYGKSSNQEVDNEVSIKNNLDIDIIKGLTLHLSHSFRFHHNFEQWRYANAKYSVKEGVETWKTDSYCRNELTENNQSTYKHMFEAYADYVKSFNASHNIKLMAGMQYDTRYYRKNSITGDGVLSENLNDFNLVKGPTYTVKGGQSKYKTLGVFGRINYDYLGKYLIELSGRGDGSSRFWSKNRWAFFPSGSAGWRMSNENFWEPIRNWWSNSKVRFSIGSLGNQQVSDYLFIQEINTALTNDEHTLNGTDKLTYARESAPVAGDLTWERVTTYDWGLDLGFLQNRLSVTGDYYIRKTTDMMMPGASLPSVYGESEPRQNAADMRTNGWEIGVTWRDEFKLLGHKFTYGVRANIGDYKTKVTRYDNDTRLITDHYVGENLGEIWGYRTAGLFRSDEEAAQYSSEVDCSYLLPRINAAPGDNKGLRAGDVKFLDLDGDNKISIGKNTIDNPGDREVIGNSLPRYSYSFGGDFNWYGFDFAILFQGIGKQNWYPGVGETNLFWGPYCRPHNTFLSRQLIDNIWTEDNLDAYLPRPRAYEAYSGNGSQKYTLTAPNDRYLQNVAYLRLKNLTVGYTLPALKKYVQSIRVYFSGENLAYWSPMKKHNKYIDPEQTTSKNAYTDGSGEVYGFSKVFSFGLDITF